MKIRLIISVLLSNQWMLRVLNWWSEELRVLIC